MGGCPAVSKNIVKQQASAEQPATPDSPTRMCKMLVLSANAVTNPLGKSREIPGNPGNSRETPGNHGKPRETKGNRGKPGETKGAGGSRQPPDSGVEQDRPDAQRWDGGDTSRGNPGGRHGDCMVNSRTAKR
jgi:hypothetical protein